MWQLEADNNNNNIKEWTKCFNQPESEKLREEKRPLVRPRNGQMGKNLYLF